MNAVNEMTCEIGLLVQAFAEACGFPFVNTMAEFRAMVAELEDVTAEDYAHIDHAAYYAAQRNAENAAMRRFATNPPTSLAVATANEVANEVRRLAAQHAPMLVSGNTSEFASDVRASSKKLWGKAAQSWLDLDSAKAEIQAA